MLKFGEMGGIMLFYCPFSGIFVLLSETVVSVPVGHTDIEPHGSMALSRFFTRQQKDHCFHFGLVHHILVLYALHKGIKCASYFSTIHESYRLLSWYYCRFITDHNMATHGSQIPWQGLFHISSQHTPTQN